VFTFVCSKADGSPPSRITFDIANIKCIVKNNGGVSVVVPAEQGNRRAFPISFEVCRNVGTQLMLGSISRDRR
jgi:hypothetical protein